MGKGSRSNEKPKLPPGLVVAQPLGKGDPWGTRTPPNRTRSSTFSSAKSARSTGEGAGTEKKGTGGAGGVRGEGGGKTIGILSPPPPPTFLTPEGEKRRLGGGAKGGQHPLQKLSLEGSSDETMRRYADKIARVNVGELDGERLTNFAELCQLVVKEFADRVGVGVEKSVGGGAGKSGVLMIDGEMQTEAPVEDKEEEVKESEVEVAVEVEVEAEEEAKETPLSPNSKKFKVEHNARIDAFRNESSQLNLLVPGHKGGGKRRKKKGHRERHTEPKEGREEKKIEGRRHSVVDEMEGHQKLIQAVEMVQKHWRGVRSKRIWVDMLEKMMDAEVDLSGLDLST
ncbi:hypothetical protein TrCOL_g5432 [Triparma columacea]|uniref:Uncharacterized protein n=1 Tax=Triparma columacea TaxID=722753 RepID=A0A9W7LFI2_9STRA|nr:hypothetical protein TrCOL_g5432 [Triparma columacea]